MPCIDVPYFVVCYPLLKAGSLCRMCLNLSMPTWTTSWSWMSLSPTSFHWIESMRPLILWKVGKGKVCLICRYKNIWGRCFIFLGCCVAAVCCNLSEETVLSLNMNQIIIWYRKIYARFKYKEMWWVLWKISVIFQTTYFSVICM